MPVEIMDIIIDKEVVLVGGNSLNIIILRSEAIDIPKILKGKYSFLDKDFSWI